jgi:hypothetical protein
MSRTTKILFLLLVGSLVCARLVAAQAASPGASGVVDVAQFITAAGSSALLTKIIVDAIRSAIPISAGWTVAMVFVVAVACQFLLTMASGGAFSRQTSSQNLVIAIFAFGTAVGSNELSKRAEETKKAEGK